MFMDANSHRQTEFPQSRMEIGRFAFGNLTII